MKNLFFFFVTLLSLFGNSQTNEFWGVLPYNGTITPGTNNTGAIFKIDSSGNGFTTVQSFNSLNAVDGKNPSMNVPSTNGSIYGTTSSGGLFGVGVLFEINPDDFTYTVLCNLNSFPQSVTPINVPLTL